MSDDIPLRFEWDDAKALGNLTKHGLPFAYAARVFLDQNRVEIDVSRAEDGEVGSKAVGLIEGLLFAVVYTDRDGVRRLIGAAGEQRGATRLWPSLVWIPMRRQGCPRRSARDWTP